MAETRVIEHLQASRLPEPQWFWRRWLIYGCTVASLVILSFTVHKVLQHIPPDIGTYRLIIRYSFYTIWSAVVLYGVGASVTDVASLVSAARTTRRETVQHTDDLAPPPCDPPGGLEQERPPWAR